MTDTEILDYLDKEAISGRNPRDVIIGDVQFVVGINRKTTFREAVIGGIAKANELKVDRVRKKILS